MFSSRGCFDSWVILTCSRKLYLFLNCFLQCSHLFGSRRLCWVRTWRQRLLAVITNRQILHLDHLFSLTISKSKQRRKNIVYREMSNKLSTHWEIQANNIISVKKYLLIKMACVYTYILIVPSRYFVRRETFSAYFEVEPLKWIYHFSTKFKLK